MTKLTNICSKAGNTKAFKAIENVMASKAYQNITCAVVAGATVLNNIAGYAAADVNINTLLQKMMTMIYGFLFFAGLVSIIIGVVNIAGAMGEEGGQDAQKMTKGKGAIIRGAIMVAIPSVLSLLGLSADAISIG